MWIRSQDRKQLAELKNMRIIHYTSVSGDKEFDDCFIGMDEAGNIGDYSSEEKALKVLDMIDAFKNEPLQIENLQSVYIHDYEKTFQMPKDSEVE